MSLLGPPNFEYLGTCRADVVFLPAAISFLVDAIDIGNVWVT